ncbi:hypothetical protein PR001_g11349, partial [Phytophthora rubi]
MRDKSPAPDPPTLSRQQQAEARRVKIRVDSRHAREEAAPSARRHGGKRLTTYQERVLSEAYGDYVRQRQKEKEENEAWESRLMRSLQSEERERSDSVTSDELKQVLDQLDSVKGSKQAHGAAKASVPAHQDQDDDVRQRAPKIHQSLAETPKVDRAATSTHTVQTSDDTALAETLNQLDEEDELASHGDTDDLDYVDEEENLDEEEKTSDVESEHDDSFEDTVCTKRKPKIHRTQPKKSTDAPSRAPDTSEVEAPAAGSFLEGFPIFWPSWKAFDDVFADFQQQTFQLFSCRTSTSIKARNKAILEEQKKAKKPAKKMKGKRRSKHRRTGGTLLPEAWKRTAERSCVRTPCRIQGRGKRTKSMQGYAFFKYNVGQAVPVIKAIPQAERLRHAIQAIDETNNYDLVARSDDYGYATCDQLKLIEKVVVAKNNFAFVQATVDWIETVEFQVEDIVEPFKDTLDITKVEYKSAVEVLNLGEWFFGRYPHHGCEFLNFRENLWLHTGSIIGALFVLRETYEDVGIINPRFLDFDTMEQRSRIARCYGVADLGVKRVISVVNLQHHWGAFFVDQRRKRCYLFDPMQLKSNISTLKDAVRSIVEP